MRTFSEISVSLDKAITNVNTKKITFDKASEEVQKASKDYEEAVSQAQEVRNEMSNALNSVLPSQPTRVRQSA